MKRLFIYILMLAFAFVAAPSSVAQTAKRKRPRIILSQPPGTHGPLNPFPPRSGVADSTRTPVTEMKKSPIHYSACLNARVFLLLDWSASVRGTEENIVNALASFIDSVAPTWERQLFFEIIRFGDDYEVLAELTNDRELLRRALLILEQSIASSKRTVLAAAFEEVALVIQEARSEDGEQSFRDIVIVVSDGAINVTEDAIEAIKIANSLRYQEVEIFALNTGGHTFDELFLKTVAGEGRYHRSDIASLKTALENLDPCF